MRFAGLSQVQCIRSSTIFTQLHWIFAGSVPLGMPIWSMHAISILASSFVIKTKSRFEFFHSEFATGGLLMGTGLGLVVKNLTQADDGKNMRDVAYV
jgi:NO-binding membrane sensor protein with MHYT domain